MNLEDIRSNVIGEGLAIKTPYGTRRLTYTDYAASGRGYRPIEQYICQTVLPYYANTHTETTATGAQTSAFREEARDIIRRAAKCNDEDAVVFTGNGVTGAIHTLITCLGLTLPCVARHDKWLKDIFDSVLDRRRPVVFIGAYEHHSNSLPWREASCDVVVVDECKTDGIDLGDLRAKVAQHRGRRLVGSFSGASNVTGRITDCRAVAKVMHDAGGIVFFDAAAAGPYVDLDMTDADAIFLSMHKFVGGPGAPGVLIAKRSLFTNDVPAQPGGGTVAFVSPTKHTYLRDVEHREEGGTPNIVGSIRAGLAMQLKMSVGADVITAHEKDFAAKAIASFRDWEGVTVLGDTDEPRLGVISFVVTHRDAAGVTKALHHNFVVALLNDLFGIQARGGNSCAAPYAHRLLKLTEADEQALEVLVAGGQHGAKPGWARISFGWYDSEDTLAFVINAVRFIARLGWCFLPDYAFDPTSGSWTNRAGKPPLRSLAGALDEPAVALETLPEDAREPYLEEAFALANAPRAAVPVEKTLFEGMRWFWLPGEIPSGS